MAHQVQWTTNLQITGGPTFSLPGSMSVDAYDHIKVLVKKGQKSAQVEMPGQAGQVQLVLITSDHFETLAYSIGGAQAPPPAAQAPAPAAQPAAADQKKAAATATPATATPSPATPSPATTPLDATQLLAGKGAVSLLGTGPISLTFDNTNGAQDVNVEILVGRNTA